MPSVKANGVSLYYEEVGRGTPLVFLHEFAGDARSWEPQMRFFSRRYRCIAVAARGYLPSEVPEDPAAYSQDNAVADVLGFLDALKIDRAHLCGLSMGSYTALIFGLTHPSRALSLTVAGCGYGSGGDNRAAFHSEVDEVAGRMLAEGMGAVAESYTTGPARLQFQAKDPRGWRLFADQFAEHSNVGSAHTLRGIQKQRPSIYDLEQKLEACDVPVLVINGDEDEPCLEPGLFMKRKLPRGALVVFPKSGHVLNLEEPALFNRHLLEFLTAVDGDAWPERDPRSKQSGVEVKK